MGKKEKRIYRDAIIRRYQRASRSAKGVILNEFCSVCGYNRKYAIRILNHPSTPSSKGQHGRQGNLSIRWDSQGTEADMVCPWSDVLKATGWSDYGLFALIYVLSLLPKWG